MNFGLLQIIHICNTYSFFLFCTIFPPIFQYLLQINKKNEIFQVVLLTRFKISLEKLFSSKIFQFCDWYIWIHKRFQFWCASTITRNVYSLSPVENWKMYTCDIDTFPTGRESTARKMVHLISRIVGRKCFHKSHPGESPTELFR